MFSVLTRRQLGLLLGAVVLLAVVVLCSLAFGARSVPVAEAWRSLVDPDPTSSDHLVVRDLRVPRTIVGLVVGGALGLAGTVMQGLTRNPLADPGVLGVNAGAAVGVVVAINVFDIGSALGWMGFAMAGAAGASLVVHLLGARGRHASPATLALAGAAVAAMLTAVTTAILLLDQRTLDQFRFWVVGSLTGGEDRVLAAVSPFLVAGVVLALLLGPTLNALGLGDDVAVSLGHRIEVARALGLLAVVLLVGSAVSIAGPIGFVGLVVPHVARSLGGPDHRWLLPASIVLAPLLLVGADVVGRLVVRPGELQVGIVTALLGAPFFVALVRRRRLVES
ncbi:FecCD family ABC transporter permease [Euzebya pacifica]|uniref:FecCD family ABC transporter permease n=1 Tax=Euzebya pacifica TaxID=1608957 RepID=UPI0030F77CD3